MGVWSTEPNSNQAAGCSSSVTVVTAWWAQPIPPAGSIPMGFSSGIHQHLFVKVKFLKTFIIYGGVQRTTTELVVSDLRPQVNWWSQTWDLRPQVNWWSQTWDLRPQVNWWSQTWDLRPHVNWWSQTWVKNWLSQRNSLHDTYVFVMLQLSRVESLNRQAMAASMLPSTLLVAKLPTIVTRVSNLTPVFRWQWCVWRMAPGVMLPQPPDVYVSFFLILGFRS